MNLKKSDKIIAVAAVVILIVAAIGVILYTDPSDDKKLPQEDEMIVYKVNVEESPGSLSLDNTEYTMKRNTPYTGTFQVQMDNIKNVNIYIEYETQVSALLSKLRENTITITVYDENENEVGSKQITGKGNETIIISGSSPINIYEIKAKDIYDAKEKLAENLSTMSLTKTYTLEVSIDHGNRILRPILRLSELFGKTDSFSPKITYEYYTYHLEEQSRTNDDTDTDFSGQSSNKMVQTYTTLGLPGKH